MVAALVEAGSGGRLDPRSQGGLGPRGSPLWKDGLEQETASRDFAGGLPRQESDILGCFFSLAMFSARFPLILSFQS